MNMGSNKNLLTLIFATSILSLLFSCRDDYRQQEEILTEENKFILLPVNPVSKDEVKMVTYDCKYNELVSVKAKGKDIEVKKRFNSQMKWPCVLHYDTIQLGRLAHGTYNISLLIIDANPSVKDSISVKETLTLEVGK